MFDFFKIVYDSVFVCQLLAVSFSLVLVFYDWKKSFKNIAVGVLYGLGIFAVSTVLNWLLFALSTVWRGVLVIVKLTLRKYNLKDGSIINKSY